MNTTAITMNNFDGGNSPSFADRVQQMRMSDEITRSMNTYQHPTSQDTLTPNTQVNVNLIRTDGGTHSRTLLNEMVVDDYAAAMERGDVFPPIVLFYDEEAHWLADGFHTVSAAKRAGLETIAAQVRPGTCRDARFYAAGSNSFHGLRRTNLDKRRSVFILLDDLDWRLLSDRQIAKHCGVDNAFVSKLRREKAEKERIERDKIASHPPVAGQQNSNIQQDSQSDQTTSPQEPHSSTAVIIPTAIPDATRALVRNTRLEDNLREIEELAQHSLQRQEQIITIIEAGESTTVLGADQALKLKKSEAKKLKRFRDLQASGFNCKDFLLGDCREQLGALQPKSVRLLLSDVPYGMNLVNNRRVASKNCDLIEGDESPEAACELLKQMLDAIDPAMADECHALIFSHWRYQHLFRDVLIEKGYEVRNLLVWVKNRFGLGYMGGFAPTFECIIHAVRGGATITPRVANSFVVPAENSTSHICEKPTELLRQLIECTTLPGELVCDPFAGTAATLVAAAQTGRQFFGVELDEDYYKEGLTRLLDLHNQDASQVHNTYQADESLPLLSAA